jgi:hypothetical protein
VQTHSILLPCAAVVLLLAGIASAQEPSLFPFSIPWDDASSGITNVSAWTEKPAGEHGFVRVQDGHFVDGAGKRIRFLGTNLCFAACFPPHEVADKVAPRMARFGINVVRFHHMDSQAFPSGILEPNRTDRQHLSAEALDRLDYLIAQLKANGIYANINLHVSRTLGAADGIQDAAAMPQMDKGVDNFHPRMIELQREYARDLLTHVNKYTGNAYVDEPAVAMIEINNENSLVSSWRGGAIDGLPAYCQDLLDERWGEWLRAKYNDTPALRKAWAEGDEPLGQEMLTDGGFAAGVRPWTLEVNDPAQASVAAVPEGPQGEAAAKIAVTAATDTGWFVQFHQAGVAFESGKAYTLTCWAKAEPARRITVNNFTTHEPWHSLGFGDSFQAGPEWREHTFHFRATESDPNARIGFNDLATTAGTVWVARVSLKPGGVIGLPDGESLEGGKVSRPRRGELGSRTVPCQQDYVAFLLALETEYWTGMADYLHKDLGVKCPVTGTQMGYSPIDTHVAMDYYDGHAYWHHPSFPGRAWDPNNWWVGNVSMVTTDGGTLPGLAARRVLGYPFTVSEYNFPAPATYSSECYVLLAAYGALQDWDGIFNFSYNHSDQWQTDTIPNFFDLKSHPTKLVTFPAVAALFRRADVAPGREPIIVRTNHETVVAEGTSNPAAGTQVTSYGVPAAAALMHRMAIGLGAEKPRVTGPTSDVPDTHVYKSDTGELTWDRSDAQKATVLVNTARSKAIIGFGAGRTFDLGQVSVSAGPNRQGWLTLTATVMEGDSFAGPARVLVTATGHAENPGWGWETQGDRVTVRRNWGSGPSVCEGIPATIRLPAAADRVTAYALDERGQRGQEVTVANEGGKAAVSIGPQYRTLWYEIVVR